MRLGVVDIGSNSVHFQLIDAEAGAPPLPIFGSRFDTRLEDHAAPDGTIPQDAVGSLLGALSNVLATAKGCCFSVSTVSWTRRRSARRGS